MYRMNHDFESFLAMFRRLVVLCNNVKFCSVYQENSTNSNIVFFSSLRQMSSNINWNVRGILLDITGVLYESGQNKAISGSVEAIERLRNLKIPFRFVTNETQRTRSSLVSKLESFGFRLSDNEVFSPGLAVSYLLKETQLRPYLLVHPNILPEFDECDQTSPNCVVVGDAAEHFTYKNMDKAFKLLISSENPVLISMGKGKYYKENDELVMDLGGFTAALEYAADIQAVVIGKPSNDFFMKALNDMNISPDQAAMVGDDVNNDVGASQKCGMKGVLVKTGKYRPVDSEHPLIKPDAIVDNLSDFVTVLSKQYLSIENS